MSIFSKLAERSWLTASAAGDLPVGGVSPEPAAKTGLAMFMAVLSSMFFLFMVGYRMRMGQGDWQPISDPGLLWFNTAGLVIAGFMMQRARPGARAGQIRLVRRYLLWGGLFSIAFLVGQYVAWGELRDAGVYSLQSPAAAFFALLTGLHALHLCGGLGVWAKTVWRALRGIEVKRIALSVELCTTYWHYLLLVWLVFFTLLLLT